ncbi:MAG: gamma-butyrobetaine hydroxylase-like domain-containing protein [Phycisphaerales bacterium JB037]
MNAHVPESLDLKKDRGLTIQWADGTSSYYTIAYLRKMSPSADMRNLREQLEKNPLTVLPSSAARGAVTARDAELVGNYAIRITFSDGHGSGIYSFEYLRSIDPARAEPDDTPPGVTRDEPGAG